MGIEWQLGPDWSQLHFTAKLYKWTFILVPLAAGAGWLVWYIVKQV